MPQRYPTNPHRLTLNFDPITSAALTQAAKAAKCNRDELVYRIVQQALGIGMTAPPATDAKPADELPDRMGDQLARINAQPRR